MKAEFKLREKAITTMTQNGDSLYILGINEGEHEGEAYLFHTRIGAIEYAKEILKQGTSHNIIKMGVEVFEVGKNFKDGRRVYLFIEEAIVKVMKRVDNHKLDYFITKRRAKQLVEGNKIFFELINGCYVQLNEFDDFSEAL
jgi:hypothetical protein